MKLKLRLKMVNSPSGQRNLSVGVILELFLIFLINIKKAIYIIKNKLLEYLKEI